MKGRTKETEQNISMKSKQMDDVKEKVYTRDIF